MLRMKGDDVQLAFIPAIGSFSDLYVAPHEETTELVPFCHERFQVICGHEFFGCRLGGCFRYSRRELEHEF